jgi:hypothetical protein
VRPLRGWSGQLVLRNRSGGFDTPEEVRRELDAAER